MPGRRNTNTRAKRGLESRQGRDHTRFGRGTKLRPVSSGVLLDHLNQRLITPVDPVCKGQGRKGTNLNCALVQGVPRGARDLEKGGTVIFFYLSRRFGTGRTRFALFQSCVIIFKHIPRGKTIIICSARLCKALARAKLVARLVVSQS